MSRRTYGVAPRDAHMPPIGVCQFAARNGGGHGATVLVHESDSTNPAFVLDLSFKCSPEAGRRIPNPVSYFEPERALQDAALVPVRVDHELPGRV